MSSGVLRQVTNVVAGAYQPAVSPDGEGLVYVGYTSYGFDLFSLDLTSVETRPAPPYVDRRPAATMDDDIWQGPTRDYQPLETLYPRSYMVDLANDGFGPALGINVSGEDLAGWHTYHLRAMVGEAAVGVLPGNQGAYTRQLVERSGYTVGELAELREKAKSKQFSAREVKQGRLFSALAETDEGKRAELVQEIVDSDELLSASNGDRLMALAGGGRKATRRRKPDARESDSGDGDDDDDGATSRPQPKTTSDPQADRRQREANKARSRELAKEGLSALGKRKYRNAEQLFNRALDLDSRNTTALIGLSDLNFEEQKFSRAIDFAERAIKVAPRNGGYRIKLGDAYFKVLKYSKAREHYERALELGHRDAAQRIKKVKDKTGK